MKNFILSLLVFATTAVSAAEVVPVLEADLPALRTGRTFVDTKFYIDTDTNEGYAKVSVSEEDYIYHRPYDMCDYRGGRWGGRGRYGRYGRRCMPPMPTRVLTTLFQDTVKIENLVLVGDKVIYQGVEGEVECGTMGLSRVFKVPTLYLTGNCDLDGRVVGSSRNSKVVVTLKTK